MKILLTFLIVVLLAYAAATSIYILMALVLGLAVGRWILRLFELRDDPPSSTERAFECTRRAEEAERRAQEALSPEVRIAYQDVAAHWLVMAEQARRDPR